MLSRSAPYTAGLNLSSINVETDRRGFVPVSDKMEVSGEHSGVDTKCTFSLHVSDKITAGFEMQHRNA
jgi:hypothetical protein